MRPGEEQLVKSLEEREEMDWKYHICMYHLVAKQQLIKKLEVLLQCHVATLRSSQHNQLFPKPLFYKEILRACAEFNKHCP